MVIKTNINYAKVFILMKKLPIFIVFLIIMSSLVNAKTVQEDIYENSNLEVPGYNISLLSVGNDQKSIVVCVNNDKQIIDKRERKIFEKLRIEPLRIYRDYATVEITYSCQSCTCNESCSNSLCFKDSPDKINETEKEPEIEENNQVEQKGDIKIISILLFILVLKLLMILLFRKKKR